MARQGLLAQSKPAATTDTLLYSASTSESASAVLKIANDGTGAAYRVALRDYDQNLALDASTYKLHKGDIITGYRVNIDTAVAAGTFTPGVQFTSADGEKKMRFESFYIPALTTVFVKADALREVTIESISGTIAVGDTITKGSGGDTTTALVYFSSGGFITLGPSTINGSGTEFAAGDSVSFTSGGNATISTGGIGTADNRFVFSTTTAGGTYNKLLTNISLFTDRTYRFDVSDSSMSGRDFKLSTTQNGEYGPDADFSTTTDNGVEFTTGKTTNGTAGSSGAYVQYDLSQISGTAPAALFWYDGGTGTASNHSYGDSPALNATTSTAFTYDEFFAYDLEGTWTNTTDSFVYNSVTYTVESQTAGGYGTVVDYTGTALKVALGVGSQEFAGTDTFFDVPALNATARTEATVSSVTTAKAAIDGNTYLAYDVTNAANNVDNITSLVIGPGQRVHVRSATQNNVFSLIGFEDASSEFTTRVYGQN